MKIEGDLNNFSVYLSESAAGTYTEESIVIADNVVTGNAILIKKIEFELQDPQDVVAAGAGAESNKVHVARETKTSAGRIDQEEVLCTHTVSTYGDGVDTLFKAYDKTQNPHLFGVGERDGELYPYKYMYFAIDSSNAAAQAYGSVRVWYYPVSLTKDELLEVTQEAIINGWGINWISYLFYFFC